MRDFRMARRAFLAGIGATAGGMLFRPMTSRAENGTPQRLLLIHRPCGSRMDLWWPNGSGTSWTASPLLSSFEEVKSRMVVVKGINCPRKQDWLGDKHGSGMLGMVTPPPKDKSDNHVWPVLPGYTDAEQNDTNGKFFTATDKSIDQLFLEQIPGLKGAPIPSVQLSASSESADTNSPSCLRVVSYAKTNPDAPFPTPLWPENRPSVAFQNIFGGVLMGMDPAQMERTRAQNKSVLDFIASDLDGLRARVPASQYAKVDAHTDAVRELEKSLDALVGHQCTPPTLEDLPQAMNGMSQLDAEHYKSCLEHMEIIKTMFMCDLTRVASFTFGFGNSGIRFSNVLDAAGITEQYKDTNGNPIDDSEGHHDISHNGGSDPEDAKYIIDKFYCDMTAKLLLDMSKIPESNGDGTLLDNTLVVFWNEASDGNSHGVEDMPVLLFGGKFLELKGGSYVELGTSRYMSDLWVETARAWGYDSMKSYGDAMWNTGSVAGVFGQG